MHVLWWRLARGADWGERQSRPPRTARAAGIFRGLTTGLEASFMRKHHATRLDSESDERLTRN